MHAVQLETQPGDRAAQRKARLIAQPRPEQQISAFVFRPFDRRAINPNGLAYISPAISPASHSDDARNALRNQSS
jgi:hypothetical protein